MCGYVSIAFIDFILKGKSLLDYTNSFPHKKFEKRLNNNNIFSISKNLF